MRVLIVRHAEAVPQGTRDLPDADRPLTADGERRFRAAARTIARLLPPPDLMLTSPLVRARQTADVLASTWGGVTPVPERALALGGVDAIVDVLERQPADASIVVVGHEPTMSMLTLELLGVVSSEAVSFGVGTAALLEVGAPFRRAARLLWFLRAEAAAALAAGEEAQ